jgi:hypoxia-inducible factor (prolyl hydroxylase)
METILDLVCQVINDMDQYGVCVVDNLLGEERGAQILKEVYALESSGSFQDGQVVKQQQQQQQLVTLGLANTYTHLNGSNGVGVVSGPGHPHPVRGDKIAWVDGREPVCRNISILIALIDAIVMGANKIPNNGKLGNYTIRERTKVRKHYNMQDYAITVFVLDVHCKTI